MPQQPEMMRKASTVSVASSIASSTDGGGAGGPRKKRARSLLRDYYGLSSSAGASSESSKGGGTLDIDAPDSFDAEAYFNDFVGSASVKDLLARESDLVNEIRELDAERQSLVYNHHHELIDASDTIRKMRSRALALDGSLDSLRSSFALISQLTSTLSSPPPHRSLTPPPLHEPSTPTLSHETPTQTPTIPQRQTSASLVPTPEPILDPLLHIPALLALPTVLRTVPKEQADSLWGKWEPAIRSWEEDGVKGARELGGEARESLRSRRGQESG